MRKYAIAALLILCISVARGDGGRLRLRQQAGNFIVTLFTTPDPLTVGQTDFSVAIERSSGAGIIQDANVTLTLTPSDGKSAPLVLQASHGAATSRFLQAANFTLPRSGIWKVTVVVQQAAKVGQCSGSIDVLPASLVSDQTTWEIAAVPILVLLFTLHQWRKWTFRKSQSRAR